MLSSSKRSLKFRDNARSLQNLTEIRVASMLFGSASKMRVLRLANSAMLAISLFSFLIALAVSRNLFTHLYAMLLQISARLGHIALRMCERCLSADRGPQSICQRPAEAVPIPIVFGFHHYACERLRA